MVEKHMREGTLEIEQGGGYWKPALLFIHAGVSDHTLWDAQVDFLRTTGCNCLRFDIFGCGRSLPSEAYLRSESRKPVDHIATMEALVDRVLPANARLNPIGLSIGGSPALSFTVCCLKSVAGAITVAGGVRGVDIPNQATKDTLFERADALLKAGNVRAYAESQVRIWGDGPLQEEGRMAKNLRERMLVWNLEIAAREVSGTGAGAMEAVRREPAPVSLLGSIEVPVAVACGTLDETSTMGAMKALGERIAGAEVKDFEAAHMVNLEQDEEFNEWSGAWLMRHFAVRE